MKLLRSCAAFLVYLTLVSHALAHSRASVLRSPQQLNPRHVTTKILMYSNTKSLQKDPGGPNDSDLLKFKYGQAGDGSLSTSEELRAHILIRRTTDDGKNPQDFREEKGNSRLGLSTSIGSSKAASHTGEMVEKIDQDQDTSLSRGQNRKMPTQEIEMGEKPSKHHGVDAHLRSQEQFKPVVGQSSQGGRYEGTSKTGEACVDNSNQCSISDEQLREVNEQLRSQNSGQSGHPGRSGGSVNAVQLKRMSQCLPPQVKPGEETITIIDPSSSQPLIGIHRPAENHNQNQDQRNSNEIQRAQTNQLRPQQTRTSPPCSRNCLCVGSIGTILVVAMIGYACYILASSAAQQGHHQGGKLARNLLAIPHHEACSRETPPSYDPFTRLKPPLLPPLPTTGSGSSSSIGLEAFFATGHKYAIIPKGTAKREGNKGTRTAIVFTREQFPGLSDKVKAEALDAIKEWRKAWNKARTEEEEKKEGRPQGRGGPRKLLGKGPAMGKSTTTGKPGGGKGGRALRNAERVL